MVTNIQISATAHRIMETREAPIDKRPTHSSRFDGMRLGLRDDEEERLPRFRGVDSELLFSEPCCQLGCAPGLSDG